MFNSLLLLSLALGNAQSIDKDSLTNLYRMDEVLVSDFKRNKRNLTPTSVSTIRTQQINDQNITGLKDLSAVMPNFFMPDYGSRANTPIYVRGIGVKAKGAAVGFYVDGIPHFETSAFNIDMNDLAAVDVYRGPQGTLYGRNAIGGIINVYTHNPIDYQHTRLKVGYGRYNDFIAQGSTYQKLTNNFGVSAAVSYHHNDGMFKNETLKEKIDKMNEVEGRIGFYWRPAKNWLLHLNSTLDYSDQGGYPYSTYNVETKQVAPINYNRYSSFRRLISSTGFNAQYSNNNISFNSQTSYQFIKTHLGIDQDFTPEDKFFTVNDFHQNMVSQEFTLKSNNKSRYQWIVGLFGMIDNTNQFVQNSAFKKNTASPITYKTPIKSFAIYHQSSYNIWKGLSATVGLRFDYEHSKINYKKGVLNLNTNAVKMLPDYVDKTSFTQFTPKFTLQYLTTAHNLYYASITRGYKPGGFNVSLTKDTEHTYGPEYSWNYEVGTRLNFLNDKLTVEASLFSIDWRHMQTAYTVTGVGNIILNAGHTNSKGFELGLGYHPVQELNFTLNYGYTHAKYLTYQKSEKVDYSNKYLPLVPGHTLSINGNYTVRHAGWFDKIMLNVGMTGLGRIYWADDNAVYQNFYATLNAKASFTKGIFTWDIWGKNLTNTNYIAYGFKASNGNYAQSGKSITFGTSLSIDF